ncbi:UNVERIFIED_CONTAM: hypothetical protein PYX00_011195 [Menopon gallinae]|uniref:Uncharacterized protein n=1 Tax=Menopon gallinae TaxID=328185 RepID=A0AAW2H6N9_9NEOP
MVRKSRTDRIGGEGEENKAKQLASSLHIIFGDKGMPSGRAPRSEVPGGSTEIKCFRCIGQIEPLSKKQGDFRDPDQDVLVDGGDSGPKDGAEQERTERSYTRAQTTCIASKRRRGSGRRAGRISIAG